MAVLDSIPIDRINREAREVDAGRALLTVLAAVLFAVGWLAAKTVGVVWLTLAWSATAVKVGWREGRSPQRREAP